MGFRSEDERRGGGQRVEAQRKVPGWVRPSALPAARGRGHMKEGQLQSRVLEIADDLMELLQRNLAGRSGADLQATKAAQAIALISMADQILSTMPVELAFEYRQTAKDFNQKMEELWRKEDTEQ